MTISLEELEQPFKFDNDNSLESLDDDIQLNNYNNILNFRKKIITTYKKKTMGLLASEGERPKEQAPPFFNQISPTEYSLYLTTDKFLDLMFIQSKKRKIMSDFITFRNIIYNIYEKTNSTIILHLIPCLSADELFLDIGLIEGIFTILKDKRIKIIGYLNRSASLVDSYLVSAYADEIIVHPVTSSVYIDINKRTGKSVADSVNNMYEIKLQIIGNKNILTESEIKYIMDNEKSITSVSNAELIKRMNVK